MISPIKNPDLRGNDPTGHGYYGAKRGTRKHKGLDILIPPNAIIKCPINGYFSKYGYCYKGNKNFRYMEFIGDVYRVRLMYVAKAITFDKNDRVFKGLRIGTAQNIAKHWGNGMQNHIHMEVYKHGLLTDPEPLIT